MPQKRKLQVFVSSTYTDLIEERQAAVEAILQLGHIPAGMELFAAGDQSQMDLIKQWIDESDIYLLLLGGRYGSIDPITGKSYTHLEYEYAISKGKPYFAVLITDSHLDEKLRNHGENVLELDNRSKYKEFRDIVSSKIVKFWSSKEQIQLAILQKLSELDRDPKLIGWVPGNHEIDTSSLAEEIARLSSENANLRQLLEQKELFSANNGLNFDQIKRILSFKSELIDSILDSNSKYLLAKVADTLHYDMPNRLINYIHVLYTWSKFSENDQISSSDKIIIKIAREFIDLGLIKDVAYESNKQVSYSITESGRNFLMKLKMFPFSYEADRAIEEFKEKFYTHIFL